MKEFRMVGYIPNGDTVENAIEFLNTLEWYIRLDKGDSIYKVFMAERIIFISDSLESCESFLLGMALSFSVLPESILNQIQDLIDESL